MRYILLCVIFFVVSCSKPSARHLILDEGFDTANKWELHSQIVIDGPTGDYWESTSKIKDGKLDQFVSGCTFTSCKAILENDKIADHFEKEMTLQIDITEFDFNVNGTTEITFYLGNDMVYFSFTETMGAELLEIKVANGQIVEETVPPGVTVFESEIANYETSILVVTTAHGKGDCNTQAGCKIDGIRIYRK